jgi:ribonuclease BN (tRNA processing enzyme)
MTRTVWKRQDNPLPLVTDGQLRLFFVGVGSAFSKKHNQNNLLVIKGRDHLLIDCGTKCPQALYKLGLPVTAVQTLLITHSHADHIGGLEEVALMGRYFAKKKPTLIITEEYKKILWDMSLKGGIAFGELIDGRPLEFPDLFNTITPRPVALPGRDAWRADCGSIRLTLFRTKHIPDSAVSWRDSFFSLGALIDDRILFTSDTRFDPELIHACEAHIHPEIIFHDCEFFTGGVHASLDELGGLPPEIRKKTYLMHYGDNAPRFRARIRQFGFAGLARQNACYDF